MDKTHEYLNVLIELDQCVCMSLFPLFCWSELVDVFARACYGVLRFIMESGAKGCEVIVSGKLRGQRAKSMKFVDGFMIHSGNPTRDYIDSAVTHVHLRQGEIGQEPTETSYLCVAFVKVCWVSK